MNVNATSSNIPSNVSGDSVPLERLAGNTSLSEQEKVTQVSRQFEAMLLRQILAEATKPVINSKFADNSAPANIYRDMIGNQLADSISKSGAIGLSSSLARQFMRQTDPASTAGHAQSHEAVPTAQPDPGAARPSITSTSESSACSAAPRSNVFRPHHS